MQKNCDSCLMPLAKDQGNSGSDQYCSYCFAFGEFIYKGDSLKEFQKMSYEGMRESGMNPLLAKFYTWSIKFAPRWKK